MPHNHRNITYVSALAAVLAVQGCQGDHEVSRASVVIIDRRTQALTDADLVSVNGTYGAGCTNRLGEWSIEIAANAVLDNDPLSVIMNDIDCKLTLTELHTLAGIIPAEQEMLLTTSYHTLPSAFANPVEFYANARVNDLSFSENFVLTILYSDDPSLATRDVFAGYAVVEATVTAESVPAPDYGLDVGGLELLVDINDVVQTATGTAVLSAGLGSGQTGQTYVLLDVAGLTTYAEIDNAYLTGAPAALPASFPALDFALVGEDLTTAQVRTLIIANIEDGVASYQSFQITFAMAL